MSMVEKVARAIHAKHNRPDDNECWFHEDANKCRLSEQLARAAIEAMREPTEGMNRKGNVCCMDDCVDSQGVSNVYRSMIDAALSDGQSQQEKSDV